MTNLHGKQPWLFVGIPTMFTINSNHHKFDGFRNYRWTLPITNRVNPHKHFSFLNVRTSLIHPATSCSAHDQAPWSDFIFYAERLNICPRGITTRDISGSLVLRLRLDVACKACFAFRGRTQKRFIARAMKSLLGSFGFYWGKKPSRILALLLQIENRTSHFCVRTQSFFCSTWVDHSSKITLRLKALRVAERNFT